MQGQRVKTAGRRRLLDSTSSATIANEAKKCQNSNQKLKCSSWETSFLRHLRVFSQWFTKDFSLP